MASGTINPQSATALVNYYKGLLIGQYIGLPKASGTIGAIASATLLSETTTQTITFSSAPTSGTFTLTYGTSTTASINFNDTASSIQTKLQAISGLGSVTVSGLISSLILIVTFTGVIPPAQTLVVSNNSLSGGSGAITPLVNVTDQTLPFSVLNGFNLTGSNVAMGVQLDVLGKYAGVVRSGIGFNGQPVVLSDTEFWHLIQLAIMTNNSGSSLSQIQTVIQTFFPGEIIVFDEADMQLSYLVSSLFSTNVLALAIAQNLFPKPMGVQLASIIYGPNINALFGFRTYDLPGYNVSPFNNYDTYNQNWPWLSYSMSVSL